MPANKKPHADEAPQVRIDPALNQYTNQVLFPAKLAKAQRILEQAGLPEQAKKNNNEAA